MWVDWVGFRNQILKVVKFQVQLGLNSKKYLCIKGSQPQFIQINFTHQIPPTIFYQQNFKQPNFANSKKNIYCNW